jgi:hypothetical protein
MCRPFSFLLIAAFSSTLVASDGPGTWGIPVVRPYTAAASGGYEWRPEVDLAGGGSYELDITRASLRSQVWQDGANEVVLSGSWHDIHYHTDAVFNSVGDFPTHLYDLRLGALYRHVTPDQTVLGVFGSLGSADERPYSSSEGTGLNATAFWRYPLERDAWFFTITYIDDAAIFGGIPLPGVTYEWRPDPATLVLIGLPVTLITWRPQQGTMVSASLSVFGNSRLSTATAPWDTAPWLQVQANLEYGAEAAKWPEQLPEDQRVYARAGKVGGGLGFRFGPLNTGSLTAGWLFARKVAIGDSFFDLEDSIRPESGPYVAATLSLGF